MCSAQHLSPQSPHSCSPGFPQRHSPGAEARECTVGCSSALMTWWYMPPAPQCHPKSMGRYPTDRLLGRSTTAAFARSLAMASPSHDASRSMASHVGPTILSEHDSVAQARRKGRDSTPETSFPACRLSRPAHSTALVPFRGLQRAKICSSTRRAGIGMVLSIRRIVKTSGSYRPLSHGLAFERSRADSERASGAR